MRLVKFEDEYGRPIWINPEAIASVNCEIKTGPEDDMVYLTFRSSQDHYRIVKGPLDQVVAQFASF